MVREVAGIRYEQLGTNRAAIATAAVPSADRTRTSWRWTHRAIEGARCTSLVALAKGVTAKSQEVAA